MIQNYEIITLKFGLSNIIFYFEIDHSTLLAKWSKFQDKKKKKKI